MTTHYMDEAEFCGRIAIMDHGEIVALDTPEALKEAVGADRIRIETDDDERGDRRARASASASRRRSPRARSPSPSPTARSSCRGSSPSSACRSSSVSLSRPTLDDVFMSHTGSTIRDAEESTRAKAANRMAAADDGRGARR